MDITLSHFVLAVVFGSCLSVLGLTAVSRFLHARAERRALRKRIVCRLCLHAFEDAGDVVELECPLCHARNERGRRPL